MELIGASWIIFIKYISYILSKLEKLKYLENLSVFFKILLVGYCIHINSVKSANKIVPYLIFYSIPWFGQCEIQGFYWRSKNHIFKMVHLRKISTTELRGNERFFYTQSGVKFWFRPFFGKMIAAPPGWSTLWAKIFILAYSVIIHSV